MNEVSSTRVHTHTPPPNQLLQRSPKPINGSQPQKFIYSISKTKGVNFQKCPLLLLSHLWINTISSFFQIVKLATQKLFALKTSALDKSNSWWCKSSWRSQKKNTGLFYYIEAASIWTVKQRYIFTCFETGSRFLARLDWNSLCSLCWPQPHRDSPTSASKMPGLRLYTTTTWLFCFFFNWIFHIYYIQLPWLG